MIPRETIHNIPSRPTENPKHSVGVCKAPMSCIPAVVIAELGLAMFEGKLKYGGYNFRAMPITASDYYDATMRHITDWWEGTDIDPASGMHHITKALASLTVLRDAMIQGKFIDDRPPSSPEFYTELNEKAATLVEKYGHIKPKHYTIKEDLGTD